jgi:thioredoxin 1
MKEVSSHAAWQSTIRGDKPVVVMFKASWCKPCAAMYPDYQAAEVSIGDSAKFTTVEVDCDGGGEIANNYAISSVPTILVLMGGRVDVQHVGKMSKQKIVDLIRSAINHNANIPKKKI